MASINFNAQEVTPNAGLSPVEAGKYNVYIAKSELKPTANGAGKIIEFNCIINGGHNHGRNIMFNLNWENTSAKAVEIGRGRFSAICHAVGVLQVQDTQQLHNIQFELEVTVTPDGKYNEVMGIHPIRQQTVVNQPVIQQVQPVQQFQPVAQPTFQPVQPVVDPMAVYQAMAQPVQQFQPVQPVAQPQANDVPDWIKNQMAQQGQPMGNG
jgi:hypothetical protein